MKIQLQRAWSPVEVGVEEVCAICGIEFERGVIHIDAITDDASEIGPMCEVCLDEFSRRAEESQIARDWPTYRKYVDALKQYPEPMAATPEAVPDAVGEDTGALDEFYAASWIHR